MAEEPLKIKIHNGFNDFLKDVEEKKKEEERREQEAQRREQNLKIWVELQRAQEEAEGRYVSQGGKKKIKGSGKCFSKMCNNEDTINRAESLNDTESLILITYKIGDEKLKGYILPNSDDEIKRMKDRILENNKKVYILVTSYSSNEEMLKSMKNDLENALKKRDEIQKQYLNEITIKDFYDSGLHKIISDDDYQKHRIDTLFLPTLIEHLSNNNITIQNVAHLESESDIVSEGRYDKERLDNKLPEAYPTSVSTVARPVKASSVRRTPRYITSDTPGVRTLPRGGKTKKKRKSIKNKRKKNKYNKSKK